MKLQNLELTQELPVSLAGAWVFFSDPRNLPLITPPALGITITSTPPPLIHPGMIVSYTVTPFAGIRVEWVTEITHVQEPLLFVDEQRFGPYRFWHHQHHFRQVANGVEIRDIVHYSLPFGLLGRSMTRTVARRLGAIFAYRREALARLFPPQSDDRRCR